ncbi:hypothetical protein [Brevundimonas naejangsanensis]|nr:hypothetical protein [Brevundimonas naejangsanensis]
MTDVQQQPNQNPDNDQNPANQPAPARPEEDEQGDAPDAEPDIAEGLDND